MKRNQKVSKKLFSWNTFNCILLKLYKSWSYFGFPRMRDERGYKWNICSFWNILAEVKVTFFCKHVNPHCFKWEKKRAVFSQETFSTLESEKKRQHFRIPKRHNCVLDFKLKTCTFIWNILMIFKRFYRENYKNAIDSCYDKISTLSLFLNENMKVVQL